MDTTAGTATGTDPWAPGGAGGEESSRFAGRVAGLALAALLAAGCGEPAQDPEAALREMVAAAEAAAEAGEPGELVDLIAPDYADPAGRDRRGLSMLVRGLVLRYRHVELLVTVERVELFSPVLGRVDLKVAAAGAGGGRLDVDAFGLSLAVRDDGDGWRVTSAEWDGAGGI